MPELPELQAHAERLGEDLVGATLSGFRPISFTALKTYAPDPAEAVGSTVANVRRRGKYLVLDIGDLSFVVHLMQGGRLKPDEKQAAKPRGGIARWTFADGRALLLTEPGTERKAGVWAVRETSRPNRPSRASGPTPTPSTPTDGPASWRDAPVACTACCATSTPSPASVADSPTRSATGRSSRRSRRPRSSIPTRCGRSPTPPPPASPRASPRSEAVTRW